MRVVFLTHYFPPEVGAPQVRIASLAQHLARRGDQVVVHTGFPHYPLGRVEPPYRNRLWALETVGAIKVVRSLVYPTPNRGVWRRLADHALFGAGAVVASPLAGRCDVVVAESPPLFTGVAGIAYAAIKRAPLVVNVADRWPDSAIELGALSNGLAIRTSRMLERAMYRSASAITVPTEGIAAALAEEPLARGKVVHLPPAVDLDQFTPVPARSNGPLRVLYAGTVGMAQGLATLVEAARLAGPCVAEITIAGAGAESDDLAREVHRRAAGNVRLLGVIPHREVARLYAQSDAAVVLLRDRPIFRAAVPTKILEGMAAGRPVVVAADGEAARLVERSSAGIAVAPEDPEALADAFRRLASDSALRARLGAAGRAAAERAYDRSASADRWAELLERVVSPRGSLQ